MTGRELLALCKDALRKAGEADVEISARVGKRGFARVAIGALSQHMSIVEPQVTVRAAHGSRVAEAATTDLSRDAIVATIHDAARASKIVPETEGFAGFAAHDEPSGHEPSRFADSTALTTDEDRVARLAPALEKIRAAGLVSAGLLETATNAICVVTTRGCEREHDSALANFKIWALETPGAGGAAGFGGQMHRDIDAIDIAAQTERAIRSCTMQKQTASLDAGTYDVVMEPEAVAELLEWLGAIAFAAPEVEQGTSPMSGRIGERITGESITLSEDPLADDAISAPFDREGVSRRRVPLIDRGVAREILYDRTYASRMSATSTGSSVAPDFGAPGGVGATALTLDAGTAASVDELIAGIDRGLYVCRLHYVNGLLEPRRAVMTGLTRDGCFLVERGKITRAVGNLRFTDSFLEALARCDAMTKARAIVPSWWSNSGACLVPAVRMRAFRFNGRSQERASF
jgi:predicted Zn-dependent protease